MNHLVLELVFQIAMLTFQFGLRHFHFQCDKDIVHNCAISLMEWLEVHRQFDHPPYETNIEIQLLDINRSIELNYISKLTV